MDTLFTVPDPDPGPPPDPYAPPHLDAQRAMPAAHAPGKIIAVILGAAVVGSGLARALSSLGPPTVLGPARWAASGLGLAQTALALAWLYAAWKGVPESHRGTLSPRRAALSLLIPLYNVYWGLAVNLALCRTLDGILAGRGERRAPRTLAVVAWGVWLGWLVLATSRALAHEYSVGWAILGPSVGETLWLVYVVRCDAARDAVARLGDNPVALGAPQLSPLQRQRNPGLFAAIGLALFIVLGVACWQLLAPGDRPPRQEAAPVAT